MSKRKKGAAQFQKPKIVAEPVLLGGGADVAWTMELLPFMFFGFYMLFTMALPPVQSFDEFHYMPAAKELITLHSNRNWEHPPLGKYFLGASWYLLSQATQILGEFSSFRFIAIIFGLFGLAGFRRWMDYFGFSPQLRLAAVWSVGFNMIWFVQSKTAMLDIFYIAFGLWGLFFVATAASVRWRAYLGWVFLGLAMGSKWAALSYALLGLWLSRHWSWKRLLPALALSALSYLLLFIPYAFLETGTVPISGWFDYQLRMLKGLESTSERTHSYQSAWWEWPTLHRPMWYTFSKVEGTPADASSFYCVFMSGNPALVWLGGIAGVVLAGLAATKTAVRRDGRSLLMLLFFVLPFLIWMLTPRKLMFFYYIMPSSFWYGPILFVCLSYLIRKELLLRRLVWAFIVLEGALFFVFLPILDGRALPYSTFQQFYHFWMYRLNWI